MQKSPKMSEKCTEIVHFRMEMWQNVQKLYKITVGCADFVHKDMKERAECAEIVHLLRNKEKMRRRVCKLR